MVLFITHMSGWIKQTKMEDKTIWRQFKKKFQFIPSIHKKDWPGIQEPFGSITYDISSVFAKFQRKQLEEDLRKKFLKALIDITPEGEFIYVFDWQHQSYKFIPKETNINEFKIPILPDGDYYIYLTKNIKTGLFGHPWERTICIFGEGLIKSLKKNPPDMLNKVVRKKN